MANTDNFRALASIVVNEHIDKEMKSDALGVMKTLMEIMRKETEIEKKQIDKFYSEMVTGLTTV